MGKELRELRLSRGMTLRAAAARVGVSWQGLSKIERDERNPSLETLTAIAAAYDIGFVTTAEGTSLVEPFRPELASVA